jgi:hypothetical protein
MDSQDTPAAPANHTRSLRSFAQREDAERARAALADHDIDSTIREFRVTDNVTGKPVSRGCGLFIDPAKAAEATRLIMKMPPSEAPVAATSKQQDGPTRLRRRSGPAERQKTPMFMVAFAIICAAGGIIFSATFFGRPKVSTTPEDVENILIEDDLNDDSVADVRRAFNYKWVPLLQEEDRNFDGLIDIRWSYQNGKASYRDRDLNHDGKFDERTAYDPFGQQFYTDTRPGESGPVRIRKVYRDGVLWKVLEDRDADTHFDHLTELDDTGIPVRQEELPKDSPENKVPSWPPPPAPVKPEEEEGTGKMGVNPKA